MPRKGYKQIEEHKRNLGKPRSEEIKANMRGKSGVYVRTKEIRIILGKAMSKPEVQAKMKATRIKNGTTMKIVNNRPGMRAKRNKAAKGRPNPQNRGNKNGRWKGGISYLGSLVRSSFKHRQWRDDVFVRDDFTCQKCWQKGVFLNVHHLKSFSSIIQKYEITTLEEALSCQELFNINNGVTLCVKCHKEHCRN